MLCPCKNEFFNVAIVYLLKSFLLLVKHLVENVTLGMIKHRFPEVKAMPNNTYILDFSDICKSVSFVLCCCFYIFLMIGPDCVAHNEKIAEKKARQSEKTESFKAKRAEEKLEKLENIKENLMARFRPDQETRVTLHNVHFLLDGELCKTSFYGKVTHRSVQVKSDGIDVDLHVEIFPRKDLSFKKIGIVSNYTSGLSISLHKKSKRFQVCLKYNQLLRDSEYCRLGSKCGKRCAEQPKEESDGGCWEHTLRAVEKVYKQKV